MADIFDEVNEDLRAERARQFALRYGWLAARDTLRRLAVDANAPDGVRGRANGLLARLNETAPASGPDATPPAAAPAAPPAPRG